MSDVAHETAAVRRGRPPRQEAVQAERRARRGGGLDIGSQLKLSLPDSWYKSGGLLDQSQYVSRWVNDEDNRLYWFNTKDDYDFVDMPEGEKLLNVDTKEESRRIRVPVGTKAGGDPLYAYLMRKPREFWQEDMDRTISATADLEKRRVIRGQGNAEEGDADGTAYAARTNAITTSHSIGRAGAGADSTFQP